MTSLTLSELLRENRRIFADRVATVDGANRLTYAQLDERVDRLAGALRAEGVGTGDRLLWLGQNSFRFLELLLAGARLGAMTCPVNWRQSSDELAFVLDDLTPKVVIWQEEEIGEVLRPVREKFAESARWLAHDVVGGADDYESFLAGGLPAGDIPVDADSAVLVIYTAAFGGRPNGSMLTHTSLLSQVMPSAYLFDIDADYVYLNSGPLFHIANYMWMLPTFALGGKNVFVRRVEPDEIATLIQDEKCTGGFIAPPTITAIRGLNTDRRYDLTSLRPTMYADMWDDDVTPSQARVMVGSGGFGQTEVSGMVTWMAFGGASVGNAGRNSPLAAVRVVDPDDNEVPAGDTGEIVVRGEPVGLGYWDRPQLNAERRRGGWWHTNDLGRREADGSLTFIGPKTRMIKSGMENIYPAEVEGCLESHPAVKEAGVIGVPEPEWVQSVKAIVVVREGESQTPEELIEYCRSQIASYKKPKTVEFVDALPRVAGAKDYEALDLRFGGGNYPGGSALGGRSDLDAKA